MLHRTKMQYIRFSFADEGVKSCVDNDFTSSIQKYWLGGFEDMENIKSEIGLKIK